jgi:hypothetical protein
MGCSSSTAALPKSTTIARKPGSSTPPSSSSGSQNRRGSKGDGRNLQSDMKAYEEEMLRKERERERMMHELLNAEKKDLHNKIVGLIERRLSCENLLELNEQSEGRGRGSISGISDLVTDMKLHQQTRRKQAKLLAEAEEKWMVRNIY